MSEEIIPDQDLFEPDPKLENTPRSKWQRIWWPHVRSIIIVVILAGFVALFGGIQEATLLQETPTITDGIPDIPEAVFVSEEELVIPLHIGIIRSPNEGGSVRSVENVQERVRRANDIWKQAGIVFTIRTLEEIMLDQAIADALIQSPHITQEAVRSILPSTDIQVLFMGTLGGINGIAFPQRNMVAVADFTSVFDFRTLAHEIGHVLGLGHVGDRSQLMFSGSNGVVLTPEEITTAREHAKTF